MANSEKRKLYRHYFQTVSRKRVTFACPECGLEMSPKQFERHCAETHGFEKELKCVWCRGEISWPPRKKSENATHLLECFKKFIHNISSDRESVTKAATPPVSTGTHKTVPSNTPMCAELCFFEHDGHYIRNRLPPEALEHFSLLTDVDIPRVPYSDERVNLAASYVRKFLDTAESHEWLHLMVRAVAFESFLDAAKESRRVRLLAFSCWCDGGGYEEPRHRQHRHLVAVVPREVRFETEVWDRVRADDRPRGNYRCKALKRIEDPLHLVNTLGYLSRRTSRCDFDFKKKRNRPLEKNHFFIFKTLPVGYRLALAVLWEGGPARLMYQELFQNVSIEKVVRRPLERKRSRWRQKVGDFYKLPRGLVLSVDRDYVPAQNQTTPHYVYLPSGRKLHFEHCPGRPDWFAKQIEGGNCFYENASEDWWIPRKRDQELLNLIVPREDTIEKQAREIASLRKKNEELTRRLDDLNSKKNEDFERRILELENKLQQYAAAPKNCIVNNAETVSINNSNFF